MKAREYFEQASEAAMDMSRAASLMGNMSSAEDLHAIRYDSDSKAGNVHDPMDATDSRIDMESLVAKRIEDDRRTVDDALSVLYGDDGRGGLADEFGTKYADVLCSHYLQLQTWREIAAQWGCSDRYCRMLATRACDHIDKVGFARLRNY